MKKHKDLQGRHVPTQSPRTKRKLLNHDRTESEERVLLQILLALRIIGYSGEVHVRCFLANQLGKVRRPDIYIPRLGLAIEVDGLTRDAWHERASDMEARDLFYPSIGLNPPWIIQSTTTVSHFKTERFLRDLKTYIFEEKLSPRVRNAVNKRIHDGRKLYEKSNVGLFNGSGTEVPALSREMNDNGFKEYRHFGGTRIILRAEYKTRSKVFNLDMSKESLAAHAEMIIKRNRERFERAKAESNDTLASISVR